MKVWKSKYREYDSYVYKYATPLQRSLVVKIEQSVSDMLKYKHIKLAEAIYDKLVIYDTRDDRLM